MKLPFPNGTIIIVGVAAFLMALSLSPPPRQMSAADKFKRIAQALETYAHDNNGQYPPTLGAPPHTPGSLRTLSTPIAYLNGADVIDPQGQSGGELRYRNLKASFPSESTERIVYGDWIVSSAGAGRDNSYRWPPQTGILTPPIPYDATNGVISQGVMFRSQRLYLETGMP